VPYKSNLNAWLIICSLDGLEGLSVGIGRFSLISPKANETGNVLPSTSFFFYCSSFTDSFF
tara:strand:- start:730 stop:912 length:183 start_codon:yes stop_codon:yes gene_type:complete